MTAASPTRSHPHDESRASRFRRDVQGLRAIAVLLVFADHLFGWPAGGFLGVDVFFVISGFLITGLLLREYTLTGRISLRRFYTARVKRIAPAAVVVVVFTVTLSWLFFSRQRAISTSWDAVWALVSGANWNLAIARTDYFRQGTAVSPLQHYWSLSVEEQFYAVWPWLLLATLALWARFAPMNSRRVHMIAGCAIGILSTSSFVWALYESLTNPTVAYFSTFTRGWELGAGALVAVVAPSLPRFPRAVQSVLSWLGLIGILVSCVIITPESAWPAPWAALPVLSTALVLASGVHGEAPASWVLTHPVSCFIGNISYSLYLWHFPVIVFGHALYPGAGPWVYPGIALVGVALATAQYYAVEVPLWRSPLWSNGSSRSWAHWRAEYGEQMKNASLAGLILIAVSLVGIAYVPAPAPTYAPPAAEASAASSARPPSPPAVAAVERAVADALAATTWPQEITPPIDEVSADSKVTAWIADGCLALTRGAESDPASTVERCVYGPSDASMRIALVGDSIAISWLPALRGAFPDARIHVITMQQCPFANVTVVKHDKSAFPECDTFHALAREKVERLQPTLTVLSQAQNSLERVRGTVSLADGLSSALSEMSAHSKRTVILPPPPDTMPVTDCYTPTGSPFNCLSGVSTLSRTTGADLRAAAERAGVTFADTLPLMCRDGLCPAVVGGDVVSADGAHLTQVFSASLGAAFAELLAPPGS